MIAHILTLQRQGEVRLDITRFGSAIEAAAIKGDAMKRLNANKRCHGVGQLNFATRTFFLIFQYAHHLWLKDIAPGYDEVGRRRSRRGLFDQAPDFRSEGRRVGKGGVRTCRTGWW